jgi:YggT family protein
LNSLTYIFVQLMVATRILIGVAFVAALTVAITHWLVRNRKIEPFGRWASFVRGWSDPILRPIEKRLLGAGGNPQHAPWWLLVVVVVGGLVLIALLRWLFGFVASVAIAIDSGPRGILATLLFGIIRLLMALLLVRVIGSWFGLGRYNRWMKIPYAATDWLVEPIRRFTPPLGMIDLSPLVAYLVLVLLRMVLWGMLY